MFVYLLSCWLFDLQWLRFETAAVAIALLRAGEVGQGHRAAALLQAELSAAISQWVPHAAPRLVATKNSGSSDSRGWGSNNKNNNTLTGTDATHSGHLGTTAALRLFAKQLRALAFLVLYGPIDPCAGAIEEIQGDEGTTTNIAGNSSINHSSCDSSSNSANSSNIGNIKPYFTTSTASILNSSGAVAALELLPVIVSVAENLPSYRRGAPPLHVEVQRALLRTATSTRQRSIIGSRGIRTDAKMSKSGSSLQKDENGNDSVATTEGDQGNNDNNDKDALEESNWFHEGVWIARDVIAAPHPAPVAALLTCALELATVPVVPPPPIKLRGEWSGESQDGVRWRAGHWLKLAQRIHAQVLPEDNHTCMSKPHESNCNTTWNGSSSSFGAISGNDVPALARLCVLAAVRANNARASPAARVDFHNDNDNSQGGEDTVMDVDTAARGPGNPAEPIDEGTGRDCGKVDIYSNGSDEVAGTTGAVASAAWLNLVAGLLQCDLRNGYGLSSSLSSGNNMDYSWIGSQEANGVSSSSGGTLEVILEQLLPTVPAAALGLASYVRETLAKTMAAYTATSRTKSIPESGNNTVALDSSIGPRSNVHGRGHREGSRALLPIQLTPPSFLTWADVSLVLLLLRGTAPLAGALASLQRQTMGAASPSEFSFDASSSTSSTSSSSSTYALSAPVLALLPPALDGSPALLQLLLATLLNAPNMHGHCRKQEEGDTLIA